MAKRYLLSLFLSFLCLSYGCCGQQQEEGGQCRIESFNPELPRYQIQAEGGVTEVWNEQFRCAGVGMFRHVIQPGGFLLPSYTSSHLLSYVEQGSGIFGFTVSGCPQTFQSSQVQLDRRRRFFDRHQKIQQCRRGDIIAFPAGTAHWVYNNGNQTLILVVIEHATHNGNQLDQTPRRFYFAGNPQLQESEAGILTPGNFFRGFSVERIAEALNVSTEIAAKLQGQDDDERRHIIQAGQLQMHMPPLTGEGMQEQPYGGSSRNGLEETICNVRVRESIDKPSKAHIYNPNGGRYATVNSQTTSILSYLQLSAARGVLYGNAIMSPHWYVDANSLIYVTRGAARVEIVDHLGRTVFDDQLKRGQTVVVPMGYAVVIRAGNEGFEWVAFITHHKATINTLVGESSIFRGLPASVISLAYQVSHDQALWFKYGRPETIIFSPSSSSSEQKIASE